MILGVFVARDLDRDLGRVPGDVGAAEILARVPGYDVLDQQLALMGAALAGTEENLKRDIQERYVSSSKRLI